MPKGMGYLLQWFLEVNNADLTYSEIESWARLTDKDIADWEVTALIKFHRTIKAVHYGG